MSGVCIAERLERYMMLTDREKGVLARLEELERSYRRGMIVRRENDRAHEMFVVKAGWLFSYVLLDDGSRQILRLHLPGDIVGVSGAAFTHATESLVALTDVKLAPFDRVQLQKLFVDQPRLAAALFAIVQMERVSLDDRIASLGRTSAKARVAALLLDTICRLRVMDADLGDSFSFPLTQEEIGDLTGLTAVHVNRMMRALVEDGLIARSNSHVRLLDEARLSRVANHVDRYSRLDMGWLPPPC